MMGGHRGEKQTYAHHPSGSSRMGNGPRAGVVGGPKIVLSIARGFCTVSLSKVAWDGQIEIYPGPNLWHSTWRGDAGLSGRGSDSM